MVLLVPEWLVWVGEDGQEEYSRPFCLSVLGFSRLLFLIRVSIYADLPHFEFVACGRTEVQVLAALVLMASGRRAFAIRVNDLVSRELLTSRNATPALKSHFSTSSFSRRFRQCLCHSRN